MTIELKEATLNDTEILLPLFRDREVIKYTNFSNYETATELKLFLERFLQLNKDQPLQFGPYCVVHNNDIIGLCGLQQKDIIAGSAELWYIIRKDYWGKRIATQAVTLLKKQASENPNLKTIYAEAVTSNPVSWHILEKAGFVNAGEIKNGFVKDSFTADLKTYSLNL